MSQSAPPSPRAFGKSAPINAAEAVLLFVLVVVILYFGREVLVPVTLAMILTFLLAPVVTLLRKIHLGRVPSVVLAVVLALGIVMSIGGLIGTQIGALASNLPQYAATVETKVSAVKHFTVGNLNAITNRLGIGAAKKNQPAPNAAAVPKGTVPVTPVAAPAGPSLKPVDLIREYLAPVISPIATFGIVLIVTIFALLQREDLRDRLIRLAGADDIHRTTLALDDAGRRLSRYFLSQLSVNVGFGCIVGFGLFLIGVPSPLLFGLIGTLLRFVPYVGSLIAGVLPVALAAAVEPGWAMAVEVAILYVAVEGITGQVIEPLVYGHNTGLSPFSVIVAAIFWSWVWGPIGLLLSTPLTLCLVVVGRHVDRLKFLDVALGDKPALTPVESFYQRVLADDPDEALDQAERLLKDCTLAAYYDDVALPGMQMAADDADRGALAPTQLENVKKTIHVLLESLEGRVDDDPDARTNEEDPELGEQEPGDVAAPATSSADTPAPAPGLKVVCVAGRGLLDESGGTMLTQLLTREGYDARLVQFKETERRQIQSLDLGNVDAAIVSYLDISGSPAHLRYLIRRLRPKLAGEVPLLVGLWREDDDEVRNDASRAAIGADYYASSFADIIGFCRKLAEQKASHKALEIETEPGGILPHEAVDPVPETQAAAG